MLNTTLLVTLNEWTNRTLVLPVAVFFPTSRCNSRCVSCDWWRATGEHDLGMDEIAGIAADLSGLGTRVVLFSGGEPLLRPDVFDIAAVFRRHGLTLHLHTSGVLLDRFAERVADTFGRVIVSLDAADEQRYRAIRGVAALRTIEKGVLRLRALNDTLPVTARSTLHRHNFRELPRLVEHARAMSLDGISFLAADVASSAFGRSIGGERAGLALDRDEVVEFADVVERTIAEREDDFASGFIAESPDKLRRLPRYYAALLGLGPFPSVDCNAPFMSVVIEADGMVRPCFFHEPIGTIRDVPLRELVRTHLPAFRSVLSIGENAICRRCVCSMRTNWRSAPWL
jgi:MoaA/NifB/PqqE/SkfB family radical SAM enzyme